MIPFFGFVGASIIGTDKVYGGAAKFAGVLHIAIGLVAVVAGFVR